MQYIKKSARIVMIGLYVCLELLAHEFEYAIKLKGQLVFEYQENSENSLNEQK